MIWQSANININLGVLSWQTEIITVWYNNHLWFFSHNHFLTMTWLLIVNHRHEKVPVINVNWTLRGKLHNLTTFLLIEPWSASLFLNSSFVHIKENATPHRHQKTVERYDMWRGTSMLFHGFSKNRSKVSQIDRRWRVMLQHKNVR